MLKVVTLEKLGKVINYFKNSLNNKVDKDGTKVLSDTNYTQAEKDKLASIPEIPEDAKFTDTVYDDTELQGKVTTMEEKVNAIPEIPSDAKFTDTVYDDTEIKGEVNTLKGRVDNFSDSSAYDDTEIKEQISEINSKLESGAVVEAATTEEINTALDAADGEE